MDSVTFDPAESLRLTLEACIRLIVEAPEKVSVVKIAGGHTLVLEIMVDQKDYGRVIGQGGSTLAAIRVLWSKAAARAGCWTRFFIDLPGAPVEPGFSR